MTARILKWSIAALCALLAACAVITVNVYFPEKDVKEAYKSLDEMLLKQGGESKPPEEKKSDEKPTVEGQPAVEQPKAPAPVEDRGEVKPQSRLWNHAMRIALVNEVFAEENLADQLAVETSSMPEVIKAYDQMRERLPRIHALFESGAVGLNKQGLITVRDKAKAGGSEALISDENESRKAVITGMAKALQKITEKQQPGVNTNLNELMKRAATTFADVRREEAKPGWWVELANGRWVQK